jgi:hypothetical protein
MRYLVGVDYKGRRVVTQPADPNVYPWGDELYQRAVELAQEYNSVVEVYWDDEDTKYSQGDELYLTSPRVLSAPCRK